MSSLWVYAQAVESYSLPLSSECLVWWFVLGSALGRLRYSASTPLLVQTITPYNEGLYYGSAGWDNGDYADATWDWTTALENGKGLQHQVDQQ